MRVLIAQNAGVCPGVKNSYKKALSSAERHPTFIWGQLAHNTALCDALGANGIGIINRIEDSVKSDTALIIRSHGVSPKDEKRAVQAGYIVTDATCSFVKRTQLMVRDFIVNREMVCIIGEKKHPEVEGLLGYSEGLAILVEEESDLNKLEAGSRFQGVIQSTYSLNKARELVLKAHAAGIEINLAETCCPVTLSRQREVENLATFCDLIIVIGDNNSSNTKRLYELALEKKSKVYWIEGVKELQAAWFDDTITVGVTAGASTPEWIVEEVIFRMEELFGSDVEVTRGQGKEAVDTVSENENMDEEMIHESMNMISDSLKDFKTGDYVTGKIVQINEDCVLVDIGYKSEGKIPSREFGSNETIAVGDDVLVCIKKLENREGELILSKRDADVEKRWQELQTWSEEKKELVGKVIGKVKGGLLVDIGGIKGFLPASLADRRFVNDLDIFEGKDLPVEIIEINRRRNKIVLSAKEIAQRNYEKTRAEAWEKLTDGSIVKGIVKRIVDFGAFVELDGVEGLLHVSEISWKRVKHPSEVLTENQEIEVKIMSIDSESGRISLSMKQVQGHPWERVKTDFAVGDIVKGGVISIVPFGAFVRIADGIEGLVHISQLSNDFTAKPADVVNVGQEVEVKILEIDFDKKRISLSIKEAQPVPEVAQEVQGAEETTPEQEIEEAPVDNLKTTE
jgi:4-hydroxy-3-methylbut-2-enyl diphosphate reductase